MYWWHVTRIKDIFEEEKTIINSFESVKKDYKTSKSAPIIEDNDKDKETKQEKINEINEKITKLNNYLKESPK